MRYKSFQEVSMRRVIVMPSRKRRHKILTSDEEPLLKQKRYITACQLKLTMGSCPHTKTFKVVTQLRIKGYHSTESFQSLFQ